MGKSFFKSFLWPENFSKPPFITHTCVTVPWEGIFAVNVFARAWHTDPPDLMVTVAGPGWDTRPSPHPDSTSLSPSPEL